MISKLFSIFKQKKKENKLIDEPIKVKVQPTRIGELGEYKINLQLDHLPKDCKCLSDLFIHNSKSKTGYSQIDHLVLTSYGMFVIETKNYAGTIYGDRKSKNWSVNGKFQMMNPFNQNFGHIQAIQSILKNVEIPFISIVSFTRRCKLKVDENLRKIQSNELIVYDTDLSEYIFRKLNILKLQKTKPLFTDSEIEEMINKLNTSNITDQKIKEYHIEMIKGRRKDGENQGTNLVSCKVCGKEVSDKIKDFCLSNKGRFKGNVYCFEHQKQH